MLCPNCAAEMRIIKSQLVFENDDTPDKPTVALVELTLCCRNPQCTNRSQTTVRSLWNG